MNPTTGSGAASVIITCSFTVLTVVAADGEAGNLDRVTAYGQCSVCPAHSRRTRMGWHFQRPDLLTITGFMGVRS